MVPVQNVQAALRDRARSLQSLHIRLLFCRHTRAAWRDSPERVLKDMGLPAETKTQFADIASDQFKAESHGRRVVVERSVAQFFKETQNCLAQRTASTGFTASIPTFDDFLCSDYFLDPRNGLPHASGVGSGYENISKYFFWLRHAFALARAGADIDLRTHAYSEFAIYLVNQVNRPHEPYYDQFKGGLYWPKVPGEPMPVMLLSDKFVLFTIGNAETAAQLPGIGLLNLDDLNPPETGDGEVLT